MRSYSYFEAGLILGGIVVASGYTLGLINNLLINRKKQEEK